MLLQRGVCLRLLCSLSSVYVSRTWAVEANVSLNRVLML